MGPGSVDSVVTDPPYELSFMGKKWDGTGIAYSVDLWREVLRVLKPGGHLLAFGGTRTYHRMTCAIEDAGFEIRDCIFWHYGTGFPKSLNLPGGLGTALKPATEPITMARKPLVSTVAANVTAHGTGALNIDACRIEAPEGRPLIESKSDPSKNAFGNGLNGSRYAGETTQGRWPANVLLDEGAAAELDAQTEGKLSVTGKRRSALSSGEGAGQFLGTVRRGTEYANDSGGASRFFYVAKPSKSERGEGNVHPTVKPIALMRYLVRLVTPPGGVVLDPFTGSGTTGIAALREGFAFVGCEQEASYLEIARTRLVSAKMAENDDVTKKRSPKKAI